MSQRPPFAPATKSRRAAGAISAAAFPALNAANTLSGGTTHLWRVRRSGARLFSIAPINDPLYASRTLSFTIEVSVDGVTWVATTAANNLTAVGSVASPETLAFGVQRSYEVNLRPQDLFVRIRAIGGLPFVIAVESENGLDPVFVPS